jgi:general secretion pathway protein B
MSYILEALRRADEERERERGAVPSIYSQPEALTSDEAKAPRQPRALLAVIAVLLLVLVGLLAWQLMRADSPRAVSEASPVAVAPEPPVEPMPETGPPAQAMAPPQAARPVTPPTPQATMPISPVSPVAPVAPVRPPVQPRAQPPRPAPAPVPAPSADGRIYTASELPEDVRRELPKLVIGGAMYSDSPGNRMLIINSQIFHEGDKLTPDLLLQEIKLKSAVLKYKGYRYAVNY